ncbi:MAG: sialidase family protein, partial [Thermoguttaceae bacterium]
MSRSIAPFFLLPALLTVAAAATAGAAVTSSNVFVGGAEGANGTSCYRIPALLTASNGDLIAFAEARRSVDDPGAPGYLV